MDMNIDEYKEVLDRRYELGKKHGYDSGIWDITMTIQDIIPDIFEFFQKNNQKAIPLAIPRETITRVIKEAIAGLSKGEIGKTEDNKENEGESK